MSPVDFALFWLVTLLWAMGNVVVRYVVSDLAVPPLFFAALRFLLLALILSPLLLRPMPRPHWRMIAVGLFLGGAGFGLLGVGMKTATVSSAAVVLQLGVPATTIFSIFLLGERVRWRRGMGIALAVAGVLTVMWKPGGFALSGGLLLVALGTVLNGLGAVLAKQLEGVTPLRMQAWLSVISVIPLAATSLALETDQVPRAIAAGWPFVGCLLAATLLVSLVAHTTYFHLIRRYEATVVVALAVMAPLATIVLGVLLMRDSFSLRMVAGCAVAMAGVLMIVLRTRDPASPIAEAEAPR